MITNNYAIDPNYRLGYVQIWNLDVQHEIKPTLLLNLDYTGTKGTALDIVDDPNRNAAGILIPNVQPFNWEISRGFSVAHAGTARLRKRLQHGVAIGGTYTFSKSIDNASSIGGGATIVAQNSLDLAAERGLSIFDQRHKFTADYLWELPFGPDRFWRTSNRGLGALFGDWNWSGDWTIASGLPFTPHILGDVSEINRGTNGTLRANVVPGQSIGLPDPSINAAVRANLSIYTMDIRGLQAIVPGGEAQNASLRGVSPYSGGATLNALNSNFTTQETLVTLAGDTGGRAFLDSNDFTKVFSGVQQDTAVYYLLGYHSRNSARDGRFRKITVRVNRPGLKLDFRRGYYAPADFEHSTKESRELQLEQELASDLPSTDLPIYLAAAYFRISAGKFYVPVSLVVPGSQIPFTRTNGQDRATLDVLGVVTSPDKRPIGQIRDTIKLALNTAQLVERKNIQYDSGFVSPPGKYHLKFVVRENQTGRLGSFETDFTIPDLKENPIKMSSVVLASQVRPGAKRNSENPLVRSGSEVIPSVTHVFSAGQHLYFYYEVYDPARGIVSTAAETQAVKSGMRLLTSVAFFNGKKKAYETPVVESDQLNAPDRKAAMFQLDVPLTQLKPGFYTCQVNVIDDAAGQFIFPRLSLLIRP